MRPALRPAVRSTCFRRWVSSPSATVSAGAGSASGFARFTVTLEEGSDAARCASALPSDAERHGSTGSVGEDMIGLMLTWASASDEVATLEPHTIGTATDASFCGACVNRLLEGVWCRKR